MIFSALFSFYEMVYFWCMEDWIPRTFENQDQMSLFLFLNLLVFLIIKRSMPLGLGVLFRRLLINYQILINTTLPFFHFLHIGGLIIAASGFCFWFLTFYTLLHPNTAFSITSLFSLFSVVVVFIFVRGLGIRFVLEKLGYWKQKKNFYFSNIIIQLCIGLFLLILLLLYYFSFKNLMFFGIASTIIFGFWFFLQSRFFIRYLFDHPEEIIYLIVYLCCLNLAPWLWMYKQLF